MEHNRNNRPIPNYLNFNYNPQAISNYDYRTVGSTDNSKDKKLEDFKKRLEPFKNVTTLEEARELLMRTMPIKLDRTTFYIGDAKCVIINYTKQIRICLDAPNEFISYDFK